MVQSLDREMGSSHLGDDKFLQVSVAANETVDASVGAGCVSDMQTIMIIEQDAMSFDKTISAASQDTGDERYENTVSGVDLGDEVRKTIPLFNISRLSHFLMSHFLFFMSYLTICQRKF